MEIICKGADGAETKIETKEGISLLELLSIQGLDHDRRFLGATVNNRTKELGVRLYNPATVRFIDLSQFEGVRIYQRTISFILQRAVRDLFPEHTLHIRHSMGASGFYCEVDSTAPVQKKIPARELERLRKRMHAIVAADRPIRSEKILTSEVRQRYEASGFDDKVALLDSHPRLYSKVYDLDGLPGYFFGALAPSTGYTPLFELRPYYKGFVIALPLRGNPTELQKNVNQEKMFDIFREYQEWVEIMGVPTVGRLNENVLSGHAGELIKVAEAFHENKLANIAHHICRVHKEQGVRLVLVSGPSSSGKTTFAKRLGIQLRILGLRPIAVSLDDYFVDRERTPLDEHGEYDYEALEAIDIELFNRDLQRLLCGDSCTIPRYDFITGTRQWHESPLQLNDRSILIVEGIHGLNPALTPSIPEAQKFKAYVSCFTSVALDNASRIATSDNRLLRRLTRDFTTRGADAVATLSRWASVRRGEERHIFPYQENADVMYNSSLFYEICVLRRRAEPILRSVPNTVPEYAEARRMLKFLDNFVHIEPAEIPPTSILREFIGGSSFTY